MRGRGSKRRMLISLLSPSKPEVQAQVCRSFLCRLNLLLPIFCSAVFIFLSPSFPFFLTPSLSLCVSLNIPFPLLSCLFDSSLHLFPSVMTSFSIRGQGSASSSLAENITVSSKASPWGLWKCHVPLSMTKAVSRSSWLPALMDEAAVSGEI